MYIKTELIKQLVEFDNNLNENRFLSQVDFGSTYQNTGDDKSDIDYVLIYLNDIEEFIIGNTKIRNKHYEEFDTRLVPLVRLIDLFTKSSYDSLLILNRLMEEDNEFSKYMFEELYNKTNYINYLKSNEESLGMSIVGNIHSATKKYDIKRLTGKNLVKLITFLSVYERYTELIDDNNSTESYLTISKIKSEYKDVVKLKRYSLEELQENINEVSGLNLFKLKSVKIKRLEDIYDFLKDYEEDIKDRAYKSRLNYKDNEYDFSQIYNKLIELYKSSF